jgi:hypothetical protein
MQPVPRDESVETPLEDAQEQAEPAVPSDVEGEETVDEVAAATVHRGLEVGEWDAAEQARTIAIDDEDR